MRAQKKNIYTLSINNRLKQSIQLIILLRDHQAITQITNQVRVIENALEIKTQYNTIQHNKSNDRRMEVFFSFFDNLCVTHHRGK